MCRRALAVILIIVFVPIFVLSMLTWNLRESILSPSYLTKQLDKNDFYGQLLTMAPELLYQTMQQGQQGSSEQIPFKAEDLQNAMKDLVSRDWLKANAELTINQVLNYFNGKSSVIEVKYDFTQIKSGLDGLTTSLLRSQFNSLPECKSSSEFNSGKINCRPQGYTADQMINEFQEEQNKLSKTQQDANSLASSIPDSYDLGAVLMPLASQVPLASAKQFIGFFNLGVYLIIGFAVVLFGLIALLIFKPISSLLRWLATTLLIPGIILFTSIMGNLLISTFIKGSSWNLPKEAGELLNNLVAAIFSGFFSKLLITSIILLSVAIIFYIVAYIFRAKSSESLSVKKEVKKSTDGVAP